MTEMNLQEVHDRLVAEMPEGCEHDPEECIFCNGEYASEEQGGNVSDKTYSQEEVDALVAAAIASALEPLQAELNEFKAGQVSAEVEAQIAAAREEMEAQIAELTSKLDAAVLEAETAKTARDEIQQWLENVAAEEAAAAEVAERREARIAQVTEVVQFPEEYIEQRADKWAAATDEEFEALLADYKALAEKAKSTSESPLPKATAMVASRSGAGVESSGSAVMDLIRTRQDPRAIR